MVELESSSKRQKVEENIGSTENSDRISSLPDSVLCRILSFLPTKTSVETSLLSRRWRHAWESIQVLDFHDDFYNEFELFKCFSLFVNGVLALRRSRDIQKMRLSCGYSHEDMFYANSIATWIRTAIGPKLEEFCLNLYSKDGQRFVISSTLFTSTNLVALRLCGGIHVNVQRISEVYLPSLKTLQLNIYYVDSLDSLLSGCPNLESLETSFTTDSVARIHMPHSLKSLVFSIENNIAACLEIDAPNLKLIKIIQRTACGPFIVNNLPNVVDAFLDVYSAEEPPNTLLNLLQAISKARSLDFCCATTKWLLRAPVLRFPKFCNLLGLELVLPFLNSNFVMNLLSKCPMIQTLIIKNEKEPSLLRSWVQPTKVPHCLLSELSFICIEGFQGFSDELKFVEYLLRNGLILEKLSLECDDLLDIITKYEIIREISAVPRASNMCEFIMN